MSLTGLVLEGGGSRAIYTSGVLDAFMDKGIKFKYVIGVSAGSCNGASFIAGNYRRQRDITIGYVNDKRYMGIRSMLRNGSYLNMPWVFGELAYEINPLNQENFESADSTLTVVVTNAQTGEAEYFLADNLRDECPLLAASCALPLATKGVEMDGTLYYDGGLKDSIPVAKAMEDGCDKAVVILTQHKGYTKESPGKTEVINRVLRKQPKLAEAWTDRHIMYNEQIEQVKSLKEEGKVFVIQPKEPLNCSTLEKRVEKLEEVYAKGYHDGIEYEKAVKEFLQK